jgi:hypothetical protein
MYMATDSARSNNWIDSFPNKTPWTRHAEEGLRGASQTGGKKEVCEMHDAVEAERCLKLMNKNRRVSPVLKYLCTYPVLYRYRAV